jgi:hypothetical protein
MAEIYFGNLSSGQQLVLQDGDIAIPESPEVTNNGSIIVASGATATLELGGYTLRGSGKIFVDEVSNLTVSATTGAALLEGMTLTNGGDLIWVGQIRCDSHFILDSYSGVQLRNPVPRKEDFLKDGEFDDDAWWAALFNDYPVNRSTFVIRSGTISGCGVLNGNVQLMGGRLALGASDEISGPPRGGCPQTPSPSPDFISITGDIAMSSGSMDVTMSADYYGQLSASGTAILGNCALNVTLQAFTPAYVDAYRIIKADNVTGQFGTFNATATNFDNRGIITITGGKAYRLSGY